jgi:ElaB/YqjD/DUF883 family membrane-anchored ribosome-binding protein
MASNKIAKKVTKGAVAIGEKMLEKKIGSLEKAATKDINATVAKAQKEFAKVRKQAEATMKQAESYIKKNPEKSAAIAAGVGVALATAAALFFSGDKSSKKGKKK